jgi:hypothetical protein
VVSLTRVGTTGITIAAALALTIASSAVSSAQIIVPGYPYPAYRYAERDASVRFDVKPKDAGVYVDGYFAGIVDDFDGAFQRLRTMPGGHEITLYLEGYRTYSERVYLTIDNTLKIRHRMERLAPGERSERPPTPAPPPQYQPGDGGPQSGQGVPYPRGPVGRRGPGPRGPGDQPPTSLPPGAQLPPPGAGQADASGRGTLSLSLQPSDAEVLVDGTPWNGAAQDRLTIDLSEGRHNIQIRKRGYVGYLTDVQIRPGETTNLDVRLKTQP